MIKHLIKAELVYCGLIAAAFIAFTWWLYPFAQVHPGVLSGQSWTILCILVVATSLWATAWVNNTNHKRAMLMVSVACVGGVIGIYMYAHHFNDVSYLAGIVVVYGLLITLMFFAADILDYLSAFFDDIHAWVSGFFASVSNFFAPLTGRRRKHPENQDGEYDYSSTDQGPAEHTESPEDSDAHGPQSIA